MDLRLSGAAMQIDGFRPRSAAERRLLNGRFGWKGAADSVTVIAGYFDQPADDPLGLRRDQFDADPLQTTSEATTFQTRKEQTQSLLGATWKHRFGDGALRDLNLMGYAGHRSVTQFLAIPAGTQNGNNHGGGIIDFDRDFAGTEVKLRFGWTDVELQVGAALDDQRDARRGFLSFTGPVATPTYGEFGTLKRDETNRARTTDLFVQGEWMATPTVALAGGLRGGRVKLSVEDHYFLTNGDDSGTVSYDYTNPVLGVRWDLSPALRLYASAARGFESPTLGDIAYKTDATSGANLALKAQKSRQFEAGAKWRAGALDADLAVFDVQTEDEIGVATNAGGRSAFQNVGRTGRRGFEVGTGGRLGAFSGRVAYTRLDAKYRDDFLTCVALPCNAANPQNSALVAAGNRIAGTQRQSGFAELAWASGVAGTFGVELRGVGGTMVNDRNTDAADRFVTGALRWSLGLPLGGFGRVELLARVDNVTDERFAGSVIVNEGNSRFFETGAPRAYLLALRLLGDL
jgi:iron complex outermembrane receptor protein